MAAATRPEPIRVHQLFTTAVHRGDAAKVREMLSHGASASAANEYGMTPLHWAVDLGHAEVVEILCAHGASCKSANASGDSPLHIAVRGGDADLADILLSHGANALQANRDGLSALDLLDGLEGEERYEMGQLLQHHVGDAGRARVVEALDSTVVDTAAMAMAALAAPSGAGPAPNQRTEAVPQTVAPSARPHAGDGLSVRRYQTPQGMAVAVGTDDDDGSYHSIITLGPDGPKIVRAIAVGDDEPGAAAGGPLTAAGAIDATAPAQLSGLVSEGAGGGAGELVRIGRPLTVPAPPPDNVFRDP